FILLSGSACFTLMALPGNWLILVITFLFSMHFPVASSSHIGWGVLIAMGFLAILGEVLEFLLGAASLTRGGSKRGAFAALVGSIVGSVAGGALLSIIPVLGTAVGLVLGAALGAMGGAVLGERSLGRELSESFRLGKVAFWGRLLGSVAKIVIAGLLVTLATFAAIV
ncbi:MAG: DUF456 domain-containing protein, partial [Proteobacteria bacterium]|nr:DUF456 domain-containing protein [Pseudomonadota bacterium]